MKEAARTLYLKMFHEKKRILNDNEAFDFYTDHIMRNPASCKWNQWKNKFKGGYEDYELWELENKAKQWHKNFIGALILEGSIKVMVEI